MKVVRSRFGGDDGPMHELFDHTADLGLRVRAPDLNALFAEAGGCLLAAMVDDPASVVPVESQTVEIAGTDREYLLFDWLRELLTCGAMSGWSPGSR